MASTDRVKERWTLAGIRVWTIVGVAALAIASVWLLTMLSFALLPITLGLLIVLLLEGPVEWLGGRIGRTAAVIVCYLATLAVIALSLWLIIPPVYSQIVQFVQAASGYVTQVYDWWQKYFATNQASPEAAWISTAAVALKDQLLAAAGSLSTGVAQFALNAGGWMMSAFFNVMIALMIGFYALVDLPRLERDVFTIAGDNQREELAHALRTTSKVVGGWLTGTLIQSVIVGVIMTIGFMLLGVPYAVVLGVLGALLNPVPYIGSAIAWIIAGLAGLIVSPWMALWAFLVAWAASNINGFVFAPRIMSDSVDLHPLLVLAALLVGTSLFGVPGMVFSIPVAAVAKGMLLYRYEKRTDRQFGGEDGVLFRASAQEYAEDMAELGLEPTDIGQAGDAASATPREES
jgi:predicted PurR-regulated permease PerM